MNEEGEQEKEEGDVSVQERQLSCSHAQVYNYFSVFQKAEVEYKRCREENGEKVSNLGRDVSHEWKTIRMKYEREI